ncbi:LPXTG cell wall anchor domain-containing protein [Microbacterium sp. NPDC087868]|uniref:LPXTG cell wall anchor domain-containing protein n=1 Tax=Microbacterium sp. NPDC087868 TaxID=3364195 RepID=UPI00384A53C7
MSHAAERRERSHATGVGAIISIAVTVLASATTTAPANATDIAGVTDIEIMSDAPYLTGADYQISANWVLPAEASPGDAFTLELPDALAADDAMFDLHDADGQAISRCTVTNSELTCVVGQLTTAWGGATGTLSFTARFLEASTAESIQFGTGDGSISALVPGGVHDPANDTLPPADRTSVPSAVTTNDQAERAGESFTVTTNVTGRGKERAATVDFVLSYTYVFDFQTFDGSVVIRDGATGGIDGVPEGAAVTLREYLPTTVGLNFGTPVFAGPGVTSNDDGSASFTASGSTTAISVDIPAILMGRYGFELDATGSGADLAAGTAYTVTASTTFDGEPENHTFTMYPAFGSFFYTQEYPEGTVVTLTVNSPAIDGATSGIPRFTGPSIVDHGDGTATYTVTSNADSIVAIIPVTAVPPTPPATPAPAPTPTPTAGSPVVGHANRTTLAQTGSDSAPLIAAAVALLLAGGFVLLARRRRTTV